MIADTFALLLPLFILIGSGWVFAAVFSLSEDTLTRVLTDFFMPLLVFGSLYRSTIAPGDMADLFLVATFTVFFPYACTLIYAKIAKIPFEGFTLPVIFMNSGFLGIPLMQLWGGAEAMNIIIVYDQLLTLYLFTFGFFVIGGGPTLKGLSFSAKSPILWAVVLGFSANLGDIAIGEEIVRTCSFAGGAAPPLAAFVVGCSLNSGRLKMDVHVISGILLRMIGGFGVGLAAAYIFGLEGTVKTVVIVSGALPAAVFSYVLPSRYGVESERAKSIVVLSTILAVFTIPLSFYLASALSL